MDNERPWRNKIGGMWEEIGNLQIDFLKDRGLNPGHKLLDVGCGCFRAGIHLARYLDWGNYHGIDRDPDILEKGKIELSDAGIPHGSVNIQCDTLFTFELFNTNFDYMIAQSVFTHINLNDIQRCLYKTAKVLEPGGKFFATFYEDEGFHIDTEIIWREDQAPTHSDADVYHYRYDVLKFIAEQFGLKTHYIGDWNHPRLQHMILFEKES